MVDKTQPLLICRSILRKKALEKPAPPPDIHQSVLLRLLPVGTFSRVKSPMPSLGVTLSHGEGFVVWHIRP